MGRALSIAVLVLASLAGCAITENVYVKDGETYGTIDGAFRGRWYNYYERGVSYLDGAYFGEAIADFERALALRPRDQRRARTYGLHFIDYFPNRELGIALLGKGDPIAALEVLERSLLHVDSGRAEYFFNRATREKLSSEGVEDARGPLIEVPGLDGSLQKASSVELLGAVRDSSGVRQVKVNGRVVLLPTARPVYDLSESLILGPGQHTVRLEAWDLFDNYTRKDVQIVVDPSPPRIAVRDLLEDRGSTVLALSFEDDAGLASVRVNEDVLEVPAGETRFEAQVPVEGDQAVLSAEDRAGNRSEQTLVLAELRAALSEQDASPPRIAVAAPPPRSVSDRVFIDGTVSDRGTLSSLTINGVEIATAGRRSLYLREAVALALGENTITVVARDDAGRESTKVFTVLREPGPLEAKDARLSIAMAPFVERSDSAESPRSAVEQNLENALVEQRRFFILDRSQVDALVTEWQLVATDLADDGPSLVRLGEELASDVTLLGRVEERGVGLEVYTRLVSTDSQQILLEKDVYVEEVTLSELRDLLDGLALKLQAGLPRLRGTVISVAAEELAIQMPDGQILPAGAPLLLIQGETEIVGSAVVESTAPDRLSARTLSGEAPEKATVIVK